MKKIILPGLLAGIIMLAVSFIFSWAMNFIAPGVQEEYRNAELFRPWNDPLMMLIFVHPFIMGIILAWAWNFVKTLFPAGESTGNGLKFGLMFWVISLPGMLISYSSFPISIAMVLGWTFSGLLQYLLGGVVVSKMNKTESHI